jgi:hypothetical protein
MTFAQRMIETNPTPAPMNANQMATCIDACYECAQTCSACADACLGEDDVQMLSRCIRLNLDCADVCNALGSILSRQIAFEPQMASAVLDACVEACRLCGDECERHASEHEHCRVCAEACRRCEDACNDVLSAMAVAPGPQPPMPS